MSKGKVLFLYPNKEGLYGIPNGVALLSACLEEAGFETSCFDTTHYNSSPETLINREKHGGVQKVNYEKYWGNREQKNKAEIKKLFLEYIKKHKPDVIAVTLTDVNYTFSVELLSGINIPTIVGGVTATLDPEMVIKDYKVVCLGEGEKAIIEFCNAIVEKKEYKNINNLWVRGDDGEIVKNSLRAFNDLNKLPSQNWDIFDQRHFYKPYCGNFFKTAFVELSRGCSYSCFFCSSTKLKETMNTCGSYVRLRSVDAFIKEVEELKKLYQIELIFLIDDNFLGLSLNRLKEFCSEYKKRINLPFYIQTRPETVTEEKISLLKEAGISSIAIGVEHGDEEYRKKYLNRKMKNEVLIKAFEIVHKHNIRSTANIILGMPFEKESMMKETIELMQKLNPKSYSINYWAPYRGTVMREKAIEQKIIPKDYIVEDSNVCLDIPDFSKERITHYYENFLKYFNSELKIGE